MKKNSMLIIAVLLLSGLDVWAANFNKARMDSLITLVESNNKGMGSISLFQNGEEIYNRSYGYASVENNLKADAATMYRVGSITKTFTAVVILKLAEQDKLSLSDHLSKWFPQVKNADKITVEQMLRHRSGIFSITSTPEYKEYYTQPQTYEELVAKIASLESVFEPDQRMEYSNSNYILLTMIAEKASGKTYSQLVEQYITNPLELKNTFVGTAKGSGVSASSYSKKSDWELQPQTDMSIPLGAGAMLSNPHDLNVFINALFNGKLLSSESLERMTSLKEGIGLGLFTFPFYEKKSLGHAGGIDGFQSIVAYFKEDDISVAITSNATDYPVNEILKGALSIYYEKEFTMPEFNSISLSAEDLDKYVGVYSSPSIPIKIKIFKEGNTLMGQGEGQQSFPLECYEKDNFRFDQAMLKMEFNPAEDKMTLRQGGGVFEMTRE